MSAGGSDGEAQPVRLAGRREWDRAVLIADREPLLDRLRATAGGETIGLGVFANTTWRPLGPFLEGELLIEGIRPQLAFHEYEAMERELACGGARFDWVLLALDDPGRYAALWDSTRAFGADDRARLMDYFLERAARLARRAARVLVLLPYLPPPSPFPLDREPGGAPASARAADLRGELARRLAEVPGVELLDGEAWIREHGTEGAHDARAWALGRILYTPRTFRSIACDVARRVLLGTGRGIKAVVVDLDDTLWGGVLGEAGLDGIALGEDYPGFCHRALQAELARWKRAGVLLACASKNDRDVALAALRTHPGMLLREEDFDHLEIHWQPKSLSIERILRAFGIGPEAVLFLDDNPRERAEVESAHPALRVLELPADPIDWVAALRALPWPLFAATSAEDLRRSELHRQSRDREAALAGAADRAAYLDSLGIELEVAVDALGDAARIAQLHGKTNQFNLNPLRLSAGEIRAAMADARRRVVSLRYKDRFGDAGLVGCAVAELEPDAVVARTFLLSCRVIGLGAEIELLRTLASEALPECREVRLLYRPTERNTPARDFLDSLGADTSRFGAGGGEARVAIAKLPPAAVWVSRRIAPRSGDSAAVHAG